MNQKINLLLKRIGFLFPFITILGNCAEQTSLPLERIPPLLPAQPLQLIQDLSLVPLHPDYSHGLTLWVRAQKLPPSFQPRISNTLIPSNDFYEGMFGSRPNKVRISVFKYPFPPTISSAQYFYPARSPYQLDTFVPFHQQMPPCPRIVYRAINNLGDSKQTETIEYQETERNFKPTSTALKIRDQQRAKGIGDEKRHQMQREREDMANKIKQRARERQRKYVSENKKKERRQKEYKYQRERRANRTPEQIILEKMKRHLKKATA